MTHIKFTCDDNKSWCGEELTNEFYFKDAELAAINGVNFNDGKRSCAACVEKIIACLEVTKCGSEKIQSPDVKR